MRVHAFLEQWGLINYQVSVRHYARARFPGAVGTNQLSGEIVRHHTNTEYSIQHTHTHVHNITNVGMTTVITPGWNGCPS